MKSGENYNSRRTFIKKIAALSIIAAVPSLLVSCKDKLIEIALKLTGTNHILGHRLWLKNFPATAYPQAVQAITLNYQPTYALRFSYSLVYASRRAISHDYFRRSDWRN